MWIREYVLVKDGRAWRIGYNYLTGEVVYSFEVTHAVQAAS